MDCQKLVLFPTRAQTQRPSISFTVTKIVIKPRLSLDSLFISTDVSDQRHIRPSSISQPKLWDSRSALIAKSDAQQRPRSDMRLSTLAVLHVKRVIWGVSGRAAHQFCRSPTFSNVKVEYCNNILGKL